MGFLQCSGKITYLDFGAKMYLHTTRWPLNFVNSTADSWQKLDMIFENKVFQKMKLHTKKWLFIKTVFRLDNLLSQRRHFLFDFIRNPYLVGESKLGDQRAMLLKPVVGVVFWPSVYISATYEGVSAPAIDHRPEQMSSPLNYLA